MRRLTTRSWEAQGTYDGRDGGGTASAAPARVGLWIFLAVITSFFALFITGLLDAHEPRHRAARPSTRATGGPSTSRILVGQLGLLVLGSVGMQWARGR